MFRLVKFTSVWYGLEIRDIEGDMDNMDIFIEEGAPILLCDNIETASNALGIDKKDIQIVEPFDSEPQIIG